MKAIIKDENQEYQVDLEEPIDISINLRGDETNPTAWYVGPPEIVPVHEGDWVGLVKEGAAVNFNTISFSPHAHGTHTESVGHIAPEQYSVDRLLQKHFFLAQLVSIHPESNGVDQYITKEQVASVIAPGPVQALVIRTLPNTEAKTSRKYSHSNWPYLLKEAATFLSDRGILHLLIDLPSVDKEKDEGALRAHRAFWRYPQNTRYEATITELVYVSSEIEDGKYLLNLQVAPFENDAAPSRPVLYRLI